MSPQRLASPRLDRSLANSSSSDFQTTIAQLLHCPATCFRFVSCIDGYFGVQTAKLIADMPAASGAIYPFGLHLGFYSINYRRHVVRFLLFQQRALMALDPLFLKKLAHRDHNRERAYSKTSPSSTLFFFDRPRETIECDWRI